MIERHRAEVHFVPTRVEPVASPEGKALTFLFSHLLFNGWTESAIGPGCENFPGASRETVNIVKSLSVAATRWSSWCAGPKGKIGHPERLNGLKRALNLKGVLIVEECANKECCRFLVLCTTWMVPRERPCVKFIRISNQTFCEFRCTTEPRSTFALFADSNLEVKFCRCDSC